MQVAPDHLIYLVVFLVSCATAVYFLKSHSSSAGQGRCPQSSGDQDHCELDQRTIAVVIPTLREAAILPATIRTLFASASNKTSTGDSNAAPAINVVVVDASGDSECRDCLKDLIATHPTLHLVPYSGKPSRGAQLNFGAAYVNQLAQQSSVLVFLHADTCLPISWDKSIVNALASAQHSLTLGCFQLSLPSPISTSLRVMLWGANVRAKWMGLPYGDQCFFMTRETFEAVGGFPNVPIMEDLEMVRRISRRGTVKVLDRAVEASPRRWNKKGVFWNTILNQIFITAWLCGVSHETIYRWYYRAPELGTKS